MLDFYEEIVMYVIEFLNVLFFKRVVLISYRKVI